MKPTFRIFRWWEWVLFYALIAWQLAPATWLAWLGVPARGWPWPNTIYTVLFLGLVVKMACERTAAGAQNETNDVVMKPSQRRDTRRWEGRFLAIHNLHGETTQWLPSACWSPTSARADRPRSARRLRSGRAGSATARPPPSAASREPTASRTYIVRPHVPVRAARRCAHVPAERRADGQDHAHGGRRRK